MSHPECSQALLSLLAGYGVDTVFGIPGNHTVELYRHLPASGIRHVTCRHEQGAGFMADGYARATGRPGVCLLISGPGLLNAATAIAQARADSVPLLVITAVAGRAQLGLQHGTLHELPDQQATASGFCRWSHTLLDVDNLPEILYQAFASFACQRPGPVHVEIPLDLLRATCRAPLSPRTLPRPPAPHPDDVAAAAQRLGAARRPLILAGGGAAGAGAALCDLAERLDAPVLNTVNAKGVCPPGHPQHVGGSPSLPCLRAAMAEADALLAVGTELAETEFDLLMAGPPTLPEGLIRLDLDPAQLGRNARAALPLLGDAQAGLRALADAVPARTATGERAAALRTARTEEAHWHPEMAEFLDVLRAAAPGALLVGDSTRPTYYAAWQHECPAPRRYFHSVSGFGTLGYAIPAAFGAAGAPAGAGSAAAGSGAVIALIGDGGAQFTLPELATGADLGLAVPVIVWHNDGYEEIANSMAGVGVPADSTRVRAPDFERAATAHHCHYARARDLEQLRAALTTALGGDRPTVIEVLQADFLTRPSGGWYG